VSSYLSSYLRTVHDCPAARLGKLSKDPCIGGCRNVASDQKTNGEGSDVRWLFVVLYLSMWAGMVGTTLNTDPIKFDYTPATIGGLIAVLAIIVFLARRRWRGQAFFDFEQRTVLGNLARHLFVLTGIIFISYLFFGVAVDVLILTFGVPIFEPGCVVSERDTSLFVWDAMAKGAFKFLAQYLHLPTETCAPNTRSWGTAITEQSIRWFTALVVVWYVLSFGRAWYRWATSRSINR
jgi:hypothetical protein